MKRYIAVLLCCAALTALCACGSAAADTPTTAAAETAAVPAETAEPVNMDFTTDDGAIEVHVHDDAPDAVPRTMPVLRVRARSVTPDMARAAAEVVFGDAEIYEFSPESSGETTPMPCLWQFWPQGHYVFPDPADTPYGGDVPCGNLRAVASVGGVTYELWASNIDQHHSISIFVLPQDGASAEEMYAGLFASAPADEAELTAAVEQAAQLAADMGFGEWRFTAKTVESSTSGSGWQIELTGQPVYEGYPVNWQTLSKEETLEMESLTLHMANSGTLIDLYYASPMEVVETVEQAELITRDEAGALAEETMRAWRYDTLIPNYASEKAWWDAVGAEILSVSVDVDALCVGYIRVPDGANHLLVPTLTLPGRLEVIGTIPGVHEAPMDMLSFDTGEYNVSVNVDLRKSAGE